MGLKIFFFGISPFKTYRIPESPPHILAVFDMVKKNPEIGNWNILKRNFPC